MATGFVGHSELRRGATRRHASDYCVKGRNSGPTLFTIHLIEFSDQGGHQMTSDEA
jgi:hypothetical protein